MSATAVLERPELAAVDQPAAHIVEDPGAVTAALVNGTAVRALCGETFVPHADPRSRPLCQRCGEIFEQRSGRPWVRR